jgi:hypothetical protein
MAQVHVASDGRGRLYVSIEMRPERDRLRVIASLKEMIPPSRGFLQYSRSARAWVIARRAHVRLWSWCHAHFDKASVKRYHPDAGGSTEAMAKINLSMETIRAQRGRRQAS